MKNRLFKTLVSTLTWAAYALLSLPAQAQTANGNTVYRCVGDDGIANYTNNIAGLKGCEAVSGVTVTTIPAFKAPASTTNTSNNNSNNNNPAPSASPAAQRGNTGPADFPRVSNDTQKQRDELGRRPILEQELKDREQRCAAVRADSYGGIARGANEDIKAYSERMGTLKTQLDRCDADMSALKRELAALK